jgi:hypothetical protein
MTHPPRPFWWRVLGSLMQGALYMTCAWACCLPYSLTREEGLRLRGHVLIILRKINIITTLRPDPLNITNIVGSLYAN